MTRDTRRDLRAAGKVLVVAALIVGGNLLFNVLPLPGLDLPSVDLPDAPGWLWPLAWWAKTAIVVIVVVVAMLGAIEEARKRDGRDDPEGPARSRPGS